MKVWYTPKVTQGALNRRSKTCTSTVFPPSHFLLPLVVKLVDDISIGHSFAKFTRKMLRYDCEFSTAFDLKMLISPCGGHYVCIHAMNYRLRLHFRTVHKHFQHCPPSETKGLKACMGIPPRSTQNASLF